MPDQPSIGDRTATQITRQILQHILWLCVFGRWAFNEHVPASRSNRLQPGFQYRRGLFQSKSLAVEFQFAGAVQSHQALDEHFTKPFAQLDVVSQVRLFAAAMFFVSSFIPAASIE